MAPNPHSTGDLATATMLMTRRAVETLAEDARQQGHGHRNNPHCDPKALLGELGMFDVFQVGVENGACLSEDYWVCRPLLALGIPIHVTDAVSVSHYGSHGF